MSIGSNYNSLSSFFMHIFREFVGAPCREISFFSFLIDEKLQKAVIYAIFCMKERKHAHRYVQSKCNRDCLVLLFSEKLLFREDSDLRARKRVHCDVSAEWLSSFFEHVLEHVDVIKGSTGA